MPPSDPTETQRVVGWIKAEEELFASEDPYRVPYRYSKNLQCPEEIDAAIRAKYGIAANDVRRLRFLIWIKLDAAAERGHSAMPAAKLLAWIEQRGECSRAEASAALRLTLGERAVLGHREGSTALVQLAPYGEAEAQIAEWTVGALARAKQRNSQENDEESYEESA